MDYFLFVLSIIMILLGLVGCLLPILPGPPFSFIGILLLNFSQFGEQSIASLIGLGLFALIVQVLDYIVPVWGTKRFGGSKYGAWGSIIGLVLGLFFIPAIGPFGIITILGGPFAGALIGEKLGGQNSERAMRAAFGSFIGFLAGTFMKFICSSIITYFYVKDIILFFTQ